MHLNRRWTPAIAGATNDDIPWLTPKETLINSIFVIPAKAGIQLNQATGHRLSPV
jgi:hypothetical protein